MTTDRMITEVVLPGGVEPEGLQISRRAMPAPAAGQALVARGGDRGLLRRAADAPRPLRPAAVPVRARLRPGRHRPGDRRRASTAPGRHPGRRAGQGRRLGQPRRSSTRRTLVPVPDGIDAAEAETLVVNGITAWQMLHRKARVRAGQTDPGARRQRRRRLGPGPARPGRGRAGDRHGVRPPPRRRCGSGASTPVDYRTEDVAARVRELAPGRGGRRLRPRRRPGRRRLLAPARPRRHARLVRQRLHPGRRGLQAGPVLKLLGRLWLWNALPNRRRAYFFNVWAGRRPWPKRSGLGCAPTSATCSTCSAGRDRAADRRPLPAHRGRRRAAPRRVRQPAGQGRAGALTGYHVAEGPGRGAVARMSGARLRLAGSAAAVIARAAASGSVSGGTTAGRPGRPCPSWRPARQVEGANQPMRTTCGPTANRCEPRGGRGRDGDRGGGSRGGGHDSAVLAGRRRSRGDAGPRQGDRTGRGPSRRGRRGTAAAHPELEDPAVPGRATRRTPITAASSSATPVGRAACVPKKDTSACCPF